MLLSRTDLRLGAFPKWKNIPKYILTPPAPATPRYNGPLVYGVRPGSPVIFRIPVSGERPMKFSVNNLPEGLTLDAAKGVISGSIRERGDYEMTIVAENAKGKTEQPFTIKVGDKIALTPPMGWNSWNCWGLSVSQEKVMSSARALIEKGLADYGYSYINVDDAWEAPQRNADGTIAVTASTIDDAPVHYTLDGSQPTADSPVIEDTIAISSDAVLRTVALRENGAVSRTTTDAIHFSKATAKPVKLLQASHPSYTFDGASTLADGLTGDRNYKTGRWIGFCGTDLEAVIDLGAPTEISSAGFRTCVEKGDWIFDSRGATVLVSDDGTQFREVAAETSPAMKSNDGNGVYTHTLKFDPVTCRYVKVLVLSEHSIPEWHGAKGYPGFLFVDEITLD